MNIMNMVHQILPIISQALLLAVLITMLVGKLGKNSHTLMVFVVALLLLLCMTIPLYELTVGQWLRSVVGDLSVLTLVVFANILAKRLWSYTVLEAASRKNLLLLVAVVGVVFYLMALGVGPVDPYRLGFTPLIMASLLGLTSLIAWLTQARRLAIILLLPLLAYNLHLLESDNLWDYLLDPVLVIYALVQSAFAMLGRVKIYLSSQQK